MNAGAASAAFRRPEAGRLLCRVLLRAALMLPICALAGGAHAEPAATAPVAANAPAKNDAGPRASAVTPLVKGRCRFIEIDELGLDQVKRCPGIAGARMYTRAVHTTVHFMLAWPHEKTPKELVWGWSVGTSVEWRGTRKGRALQPDSLILSVIGVDEDTGRGGPSVLAVMRAQPGGTCVAAIVDVASTPNAGERARALADTQTRGFDCRRDAPRIVGTLSPFAKLTLERVLELRK